MLPRHKHWGSRTGSVRMKCGASLIDRSRNTVVGRPEQGRVPIAYQPVSEDHPARVHCRAGLELVSKVANQRSSPNHLHFPEPNLGLEEDPPGVLGVIQRLPERRGHPGSVRRLEEHGASRTQLATPLRRFTGEQSLVEAASPHSR